MTTDLEPDYTDIPLERVPPQDFEAEQGALGACLLSKTALAEVRDAVEVAAFYQPRHQVIFSAILHMDSRGLSVDQITLGKYLADTGDLMRVGGAAYLYTLVRAVPTAANGEYYAEIVQDRGLRRSLIELGTRTAQAGYSTTGETTDLIERVVAESRDLRDRGMASEDLPVEDILDFVQHEDTYDWVVPGLLERQDRLILTASEGGGKALALDTPVPTPKGWTTMGELTVGQEVFAPDGTITRIIAATEPMLGRPCYRMQFSDGAEIVADAAHLWLTETLLSREATARHAKRGPLKPHGTDQAHKRKYFPQVVTTEHIAQTLTARGGHALNHSIETCAPLQYPAQQLSIDPYALGAWLGDGHSAGSRITCDPEDAEIIENIRAAGIPVRKMTTPFLWTLGDGTGKGKRGDATIAGKLRALGVLNNKHIPTIYLRASAEQRLALLQGLMDTDGTALGSNKCEFSVTNKALADGFLELVLGLGIKATLRQDPATLNGRIVGIRYRIQFITALPVFRLARKANRMRPLRTRRAELRYIKAVDPVDPVPVRCIQVDRADGMFVVGRECIPTHNSTLLRQMSVTLAAGIHPFRTWEVIDPVKVLTLDCENGEAASRRKFRPLLAAAEGLEQPVRRGQFHIECRPQGLDLTRPSDRAWAMRRVEKIKPDVLIIGPVYRLHAGNPNDEELARKVSVVIDEARATAGCTVLMEAHAPHGNNMGPRSLRPLGSSLWMRWPEFGFGLRPVEDEKSAQNVEGARGRRVVPWRGSRDERDWPQFIKQGEKWPWISYKPIDADQYSGYSETGAIW
ncbi:hypothetical protein SGFS_013450 [Streptomyces graminofaciens]|uniref:DNA 5'-3' helicase DnaB n=1 Tax=Streptomyces graminofaciens TaxID=68212 RepID=A0ABM7F2Q2_9ACTN|nr:DnaB-like helicase N-terminal domain-containing protein [Streptomyces graminofaciens]BBC30051.1 hypothetical protein SGFS_013450 [Streptomyces graminofaciens]